MMTLMVTSSLTRLSPTRFLTRPDQRPDPNVGPTRSTIRPECWPDPVNDPTRMLTDPVNDPTRMLTRPGQRPGLANVRPGQQTQQPVTRAATRFHTRRTFWWRVRVRVRVFLGNLDIRKLVLKFSTMWYIYFLCLKLLQI